MGVGAVAARFFYYFILFFPLTASFSPTAAKKSVPEAAVETPSAFAVKTFA